MVRQKGFSDINKIYKLQEPFKLMEEPEEIEIIESRITAGSITDIVGLREIERIGYLQFVSEMIREEKEKFIHSLEFYTDVEEYVFDMLVKEDKDSKRLFNLEDINKVLKKEGFYIANFQFQPLFNNLYDFGDGNKGYFFGTGDLYEEKKISLEDRIKIPRIKLPNDFVLTNN